MGVRSLTGVRSLAGARSLTGKRSHHVVCTDNCAALCRVDVWRTFASVSAARPCTGKSGDVELPTPDRAKAGGGVDGGVGEPGADTDRVAAEIGRAGTSTGTGDDA